jgi:NHL repeat-containing protein
MNRSWVTRTAKLARGASPALALALVSGAVLTGGGPALAAAHGTSTVTQHAARHTVRPAAAGDISTVAGGPGGPDPGTAVGLPSACGVTVGPSGLSIGDAADVQHVSLSTGTLTTQAGTGSSTTPIGNAVPGTTSGVFDACGVTTDHAGNLVLGDYELVRVVAAGTGTYYGQAMTAGDIYTVAGGGSDLGSGVPATSAGLDAIGGVAVDAAGNLVIADTGYGRVQVVAVTTGTYYGIAMTAGDIYLVAGGGRQLGNGVTATKARLFPQGVAVDAAGDLIIADSDYDEVRVVAASTGNFYGQAMTAGNIYTIAGTGKAGYQGDGGPGTTARLRIPWGVATGAAGNVLIADSGNHRIRVVAAHTGTYYGQAMTEGDIYTVAGDAAARYSGDGGPATKAALDFPQAVGVDSSGNLLIADTANDRVRVVAAHTGTYYGQAMTERDIYTVAGDGYPAWSGDGGPATSAELQFPTAVAVDTAGNQVISDTGNQRIRMVAAVSGTYYGQAMTAGNIYTVAGDGKTGTGGDGGPATSARLNPAGVAIDSAGNLLIADGNRVQVVAAATGTYYGQAMTEGDIYNIAGNGLSRYNGDGIPATDAALGTVDAVVPDASGNLVIADAGNDRIRVVATSNGRFYGQQMKAGYIYTVAGGGNEQGSGIPATSAFLAGPRVVTVDSSGNLLLGQNQLIQVVAEHTGSYYGQAMITGDIYTIAGGGTNRATSGIPALDAQLYGPAGMTLDASGNIVFSSGLSIIQVIATSAGTFYGQSMTAGYLYSIAGDGTAGYDGDGGPATATELDGPEGVAFDHAGDLLIADSINNRVREVAAG